MVLGEAQSLEMVGATSPRLVGSGQRGLESSRKSRVERQMIPRYYQQHRIVRESHLLDTGKEPMSSVGEIPADRRRPISDLMGDDIIHIQSYPTLLEQPLFASAFTRYQFRRPHNIVQPVQSYHSLLLCHGPQTQTISSISAQPRPIASST